MKKQKVILIWFIWLVAALNSSVGNAFANPELTHTTDGPKTTTTLPNIKDDEEYDVNPVEEQQLHEVVVNGERPEVKSGDGVMRIDLGQIVKDKPVTNILESLSYLPGVINNDGLIGLSGATSTTIIINGESSQMSDEQLYQLLYSLPIDRLKNVEVMYSAPAKYHVAGAVINIVLKTPSALEGLQGQGRIGFDQAHYAFYGAGLSAVYAMKRWNFGLNYSLSNPHTFTGEDMTSLHALNNAVHRIEDQNRSSKKALANLIHSSVGYSLGANSLIRLTYNTQIKCNVLADNSSTGTLGSFLNHSTFDGPIKLHNFNLYYKTGFGLTLNADYLTYREKRHQLMSDQATKELLVNSSNAQKINRYRFTADMEHNLKGWTLGYGAMYSGSDDRSSMSYIMPENPGFSNSLKEHSAKVYVALAHSFPWGLSFQTSLGEELYRREGEAGGFNNNFGHNNLNTLSTSIYQNNSTVNTNTSQGLSVSDRTNHTPRKATPKANKNNWIFSPTNRYDLLP